MSNPRRTPLRARDPAPPMPASSGPGQDGLYVPSRLRSNKVLKGLVNAFILFMCGWGVHYFATWYSEYDYWLYWFIIFATWRYARFILNCIGWLLYKPAPLSRNPTYTANRDVTVILPTIDPTGVDFQECISTCAQNEPSQVIVITAGDELLVKTKQAIDYYIKHYPKTNFIVDRALIASKRAQVAVAVPLVRTAITVMLDDHVFWKKKFLGELLAPFEDPEIGLVGTNKKVRRLPDLSIWRRIWNMLGATYLYRHNFEVRSANYWDGGAFVISARTCGLRTRIIQDPEYLAGYVDERFLFGLCGPLNPDDDNYSTRFAVRKGWRIKFQYTDDAEIETTVGVTDPVHKKFLGQCSRWARTTWRSNPCSLFTDGSVWAYQPYCVYAVYLTSFTNFALFTDVALLTLYGWTKQSTDTSLYLLGTWIVFVKFVKVSEYYIRHLQDIWTFPAYVFFAYFHSIIKLWALITFYDHAWTGRNLGAIKTQANPAGTEAGATAGAQAVAANLQRSMSVSSTTSSLRIEKEGLSKSIEWMKNLGTGATRLHKSQNIFGGNQVGILEGMKGVGHFISKTYEAQKRIIEQQNLVIAEVGRLTGEAYKIEEFYKTMNANETRNQTALTRLRGQLLRLEERNRELIRIAGTEIKSPPLSPTAIQAIKLASQFHQRSSESSTQNTPTFRFGSPSSTRSERAPGGDPRPSFFTGTMRTPQHQQVQQVREQAAGSGFNGSSDTMPRPPPLRAGVSDLNDSFPPPAGGLNTLGSGNFNIPTVPAPSPGRDPTSQDSFPPPGENTRSSPGDGFPPASRNTEASPIFNIPQRPSAGEILFGGTPSSGVSPVRRPPHARVDDDYSGFTPEKQQEGTGAPFPPTPQNLDPGGQQSTEEFSPVGVPSNSPSGFTPAPKPAGTGQPEGTTPSGDPPGGTASSSSTTPFTACQTRDAGSDKDRAPTRSKGDRRASKEQNQSVSSTLGTPPKQEEGCVRPNNPRTPEKEPVAATRTRTTGPRRLYEEIPRDVWRELRGGERR
ncbi:family 2 putative glycosyltransferase [Triangularia setosa]|uniref:Family 2 putative glycosyltransferase n=1 Tax=Triangularia setosa TaxID=2587417 RepID=A0AAN6W0Z5_9PEZI|nr:family 2 putative glycosyltransferase [Podospora setosa]